MSAHLVIMAGGSGTRFWPKSTGARPKQLLAFGASGKTLIRETLDRFDGVVAPGDRMIVTTEALKKAIVAEAPGAQVLGEPQARNTAPCVYWAARVIAEKDPQGVMLVMPADHFMGRPDAFRQTLRQAIERAQSAPELVALGVKPERPETGYGYLRLGATVTGSPGCTQVAAFVEKPDLARAKQFVESGEYLWNGGMFVWRVSEILAAFDRFMPEMKRAWDEERGDVSRAYPRLTATSIDYGVMEKARNVTCFTLDCAWDDVGSWTSLEGLADVLGARREGGTVTGGETIAIDATGNIVDVPGRLIALLGVKDLIVVEHQGALLVADKSRAQDLRLVVERVRKEKPSLA